MYIACIVASSRRQVDQPSSRDQDGAAANLALCARTALGTADFAEFSYPAK